MMVGTTIKHIHSVSIKQDETRQPIIVCTFRNIIFRAFILTSHVALLLLLLLCMLILVSLWKLHDLLNVSTFNSQTHTHTIHTQIDFIIKIMIIIIILNFSAVCLCSLSCFAFVVFMISIGFI